MPAGPPSPRQRDVESDSGSLTKAAARDAGTASLQPTSQEPSVHRPVRTPASLPAAWPSQRPTTAIDWLDRPEQYYGTQAEAEAMANHIRYTMSLLSERIRLDTEVQRDSALKTALIQEKERLGLLLRAVRAQAEGTLTNKERADILAARKRLETSHRKEIVPRELLIEEFVREGRKDGPPPGKYPTTSSSGNVDLVPVDVNFP